MNAETADRLCSAGTRLALSLADTCSMPRLSILIFHRVLEKPDPLFPEEIDGPRFDRLMGLVAGSFQVLLLGDAIERLRSGMLPPRALAITFDDGYANNAQIALPILRRHALPATFFISTGFLDGGRMWNDTIIESFRRTQRERIDLVDFELGLFELTSAGERRAAIEALLPRVKYLALAARDAAVARLQTLAAVPNLPRDLMMRSDQVLELNRAGMEIGAHTVHHPLLTELSDAAAEAEIRTGRQHLQSLLDTSVNVFAYPNGRPGRDYDARHAAMVRALGFRGAVGTQPGVATSSADPFQLPRFTPWDHQPYRWAARLLWHRFRAVQYDLAGATA